MQMFCPLSPYGKGRRKIARHGHSINMQAAQVAASGSQNDSCSTAIVLVSTLKDINQLKDTNDFENVHVVKKT